MSSSCHSLNHLQFIAVSDANALVSIICHLLKVPLDIGEDDPFAGDLGSPTQAQDELGDDGETTPTTPVQTTPHESPRPVSLEPVADREEVEVGPARSVIALTPPTGLPSVSEDEDTEPGRHHIGSTLVHC